MKIQIFITTYQNEEFLYNNIESLLKSDIINYNYNINVINNYTSHFNISSYLEENNINILNNYLRPDFSTGHLSRNWNQGIINGFKSLKNPDCDILVLTQNDNIFKSNWASYIIDKHNTYDFITMGGGDQYHSYKPEHIVKVGLWDERFCNIGYQEYDYFIRSYLYNGGKSSINDPKHKRVFNPIENEIIVDDDKLIGGMRQDPFHLDSVKHHDVSCKILKSKWGENAERAWDLNYLNTLNNSNIPNFIYYPYFEKDIDLSNKNYIY